MLGEDGQVVTDRCVDLGEAQEEHGAQVGAAEVGVAEIGAEQVGTAQVDEIVSRCTVDAPAGSGPVR